MGLIDSAYGDRSEVQPAHGQAALNPPDLSARSPEPTSATGLRASQGHILHQPTPNLYTTQSRRNTYPFSSKALKNQRVNSSVFSTLLEYVAHGRSKSVVHQGCGLEVQ